MLFGISAAVTISSIPFAMLLIIVLYTKNKKLLALAAIGNPENFFQLVEKNNLKIFKKKIFPDHYQFSKAEMQNILREAEMENYQVIMTEKDYYKINHYKLKKINYLRVSLEIYNKEKLFKKINSLYV